MGVLTILKEELVKQLEQYQPEKMCLAGQEAIRLALDKAYSYGWYDRSPEVIIERRKGERRRRSHDKEEAR